MYNYVDIPGDVLVYLTTPGMTSQSSDVDVPGYGIGVIPSGYAGRDGIDVTEDVTPEVPDEDESERDLFSCEGGDGSEVSLRGISAMTSTGTTISVRCGESSIRGDASESSELSFSACSGGGTSFVKSDGLRRFLVSSGLTGT